MMVSYQAIIAQSSNPQPSPPPGPVLEWSILGAIVFFVVKEGVSFFKDKDSAESALTSSLITDIRDTNKELRDYLQKQERIVDVLRVELQGMEARLTRRQTEIILDSREKLVPLGKAIDAIHARLDKAGLHPASEARNDEPPT